MEVSKDDGDGNKLPEKSKSESDSSSPRIVDSKRERGTVGEKKKKKKEEGGTFECNICFCKAKEPVLTVCGHLFCWRCLFTWMKAETSKTQICPVCRAGLERKKIIPVFGRGGGKMADINKDPIPIPSRPRAERPTPRNNPNYRPDNGNVRFNPQDFVSNVAASFFGGNFFRGGNLFRGRRPRRTTPSTGNTSVDALIVKKKKWSAMLLFFAVVVLFLIVGY